MRKQELFIFIGIITFVTIIFFTYVLISLFSGKEELPPTPKPSTLPTRSTFPRSFDNTPSAQPSVAPIPSVLTGLTKDELINQLPLRTELFNVEYYFQDDLFKVTIKENPYEENKAKAEEWFENLGFDPKNLNIYWFAFPEVQR